MLMVKFKGYVKTNVIGSVSNFEFEIDDEDFKDMDEDEIEEFAMEVMLDQIEWGIEQEE